MVLPMLFELNYPCPKGSLPFQNAAGPSNKKLALPISTRWYVLPTTTTSEYWEGETDLRNTATAQVLTKILTPNMSFVCFCFQTMFSWNPFFQADICSFTGLHYMKCLCIYQLLTHV